jgi:hypothetical protein
MPPPAVYLNRWTSDKRWDRIKFRTGRGAQSSEFNELQDILRDRSDRLGRGVYKDGHVVENARAVVLLPPNGDGTNCLLEAGRVALRGTVVEMPAGLLTIPMVGHVVLGIRYREVELSELDDDSLLSQAVGTRGYLEPGANRVREDFAWGWVTETDADPFVGWDAFYPVYEVVNGNVVTRDVPPVLDPLVSVIAKYDRESHGNYVVRGFDVSYVDISLGNYRFDVSSGVANVGGYKVERASNTILTLPTTNTTIGVVGEPHPYRGHVAGGVTPTDQETIYLNKSPIATLTRILGTRTKTITLTKGNAGAADTLPDTTIMDILSVTSLDGTTVYARTTSWLQTGATVDWSPGGPEPAVGASYRITYTYQTEVQPVATGNDFVILTGLTADSEVFIDYTYSLPRKDLVALNADGGIQIYIGESQARNPAAPKASDDQVALATITHTWVGSPKVKTVAIRAIPFNEIQLMRNHITDLYELVAMVQLRNEGNLLIQGEKLGVFVDSFKDDSMRDAANPQTAAIIDHTLQLPVAGDAHPPNNTTELMKYQTLDFVLEPVVVQNNKTGCMFVNPYQYIEPPPDPVIDPPHPVDPPPIVTITPPIDPWVEPPPVVANDPPVIPPLIVSPPPDPAPPSAEDEWNEPAIYQMRYSPPSGGLHRPWNYYGTETILVNGRRVGVPYMRGGSVQLRVQGVKPGEIIEIDDFR